MNRVLFPSSLAVDSQRSSSHKVQRVTINFLSINFSFMDVLFTFFLFFWRPTLPNRKDWSSVYCKYVSYVRMKKENSYTSVHTKSKAHKLLKAFTLWQVSIVYTLTGVWFFLFCLGWVHRLHWRSCEERIIFHRLHTVATPVFQDTCHIGATHNIAE